MIKILRIASVLCVVTMGTWITLAAQPNQAGNKKNPSSQKESPPPSVTFIDNEETGKAAEKPNDSPPKWYTALIEKPEWFLVLAAFGTLYVIYIQASEMANATEEMRKSTAAVEKQAAILERQTKAVEDSVALQKTLKRQWLETETWRAFRNNEGTELLVSFRIVNPTDMPLTLRVIEIYQLGRNETFTLERILEPKGHRAFDFAVPIGKESLRLYSENALVVHIFGNFSFIDNFGDWREQRIGHVCIGGIRGFTFSQFEGWLPSEDEEDRNE